MAVGRDDVLDALSLHHSRMQRIASLKRRMLRVELHGQQGAFSGWSAPTAYIGTFASMK